MLQLTSDDSSTDAFVGITAWKGSVKSLLCILVTSLGWESAHEADFLWKLFIACWIIAVTNRIASIFFFQEKCGQYWLTNSFTTVGENKNKLLRKANTTVCVCSCCLKPYICIGWGAKLSYLYWRKAEAWSRGYGCKLSDIHGTWINFIVSFTVFVIVCIARTRLVLLQQLDQTIIYRLKLIIWAW